MITERTLDSNISEIDSYLTEGAKEIFQNIINSITTFFKNLWDYIMKLFTNVDKMVYRVKELISKGYKLSGEFKYTVNGINMDSLNQSIQSSIKDVIDQANIIARAIKESSVDQNKIAEFNKMCSDSREEIIKEHYVNGDVNSKTDLTASNIKLNYIFSYLSRYRQEIKNTQTFINSVSSQLKTTLNSTDQNIINMRNTFIITNSKIATLECNILKQKADICVGIIKAVKTDLEKQAGSKSETESKPTSTKDDKSNVGSNKQNK